MNTEQKAKAYDEALERAKDFYKGYKQRDNQLYADDLESIFPELKESEDKRIREELLKHLKEGADGYEPAGGSEDYKRWLDWFEKQGEQVDVPKWKYKSDNSPLLRDSIILNKYGCVAKSPSGALVSDVWVMDYAELAKLPKEEIGKQGEQKSVNSHFTPEQADILDKHIDEFLEQKSVDKVEPKFHEGDWIVHRGTKNIYQVVAITDNQYRLKHGNNYTAQKCAAVDRCARLWDIIKDAKDGDVLLSPSTPAGDKECPFIFKEIDKNGIVRFYAALLQSEKLKIADGITNVIGYANAGYHIPATKEQRDALMKAMADAGYEWSDKDRKLIKIVK